MAKIQRSYRLEEKQVKQIDELMKHYEVELSEQLGINVSVSAATVLELLVKRDFERIQKEKGDDKNDDIQK